MQGGEGKLFNLIFRSFSKPPPQGLIIPLLRLLPHTFALFIKFINAGKVRKEYNFKKFENFNILNVKIAAREKNFYILAQMVPNLFEDIYEQFRI